MDNKEDVPGEIEKGHVLLVTPRVDPTPSCPRASGVEVELQEPYLHGYIW